MVSRSTPRASTLVEILPTDCAASVCKRMPRSRVIQLISSIGCMVPTSLLACMMLTRMVRGVIARRTSSGSTRPERSTGTTAYAVAKFAQEAAGFKDSRVLDGAGDDVIAPGPQRPGDPLEGKVVGLAAPAREDDFVALTAEQRRHLAARRLDCRLGPRRRPMPARRIAEMILEKGPHGRGDLGIDRRAGVVVEIDPPHGQNTSSLSASRWPLPARPWCCGARLP